MAMVHMDVSAYLCHALAYFTCCIFVAMALCMCVIPYAISQILTTSVFVETEDVLPLNNRIIFMGRDL